MVSMSAFIVSAEHIDALVAAGLMPTRVVGSKHSWCHNDEWHELTHANATEVGRMLLAENERSVGYRYSAPGREAIYGEGWDTPDQPLPGTYRMVEVAPGVEPVEMPEWIGYTFTRPKRQFSPVEILKLISCFDYQACETDDWRESEAFAFCEALKDRMIGCLPGYEDAPWGL